MRTEIRTALKKDIPILCSIWKTCFDDDEEYIKLFYEKNFERIEVLVLCENENIVSMVHLLNAAFVDSKGCQNAKYVYAGATFPEYRKNGYFGMLLKHATDNAKKSGDILFLKPATPILAKSFDRFDFKVDSYFNLVTIYPKDKQEFSSRILSSEEYNNLRNAAFSYRPYVKWENEHIEWCIEENEYYSGETLEINLENNRHFIMAYPDGDTLIVNETDMNLSELKRISGALCEKFCTKLIKAYMPDYSCDEGERIISSSVFNSTNKNTYANLILI